MRWSAALMMALAVPAAASPPPPPPAFVVEAAKVLTEPAHHDPAEASRFFADDVVATVNGAVIARGRVAWLAWRAAAYRNYVGRTLGSAQGWSGDASGGGSLMVIDTFDDIDRTKVPSNMLVDPRFKTRATLYRFRADGLIHAVEMLRVEGFWDRQEGSGAR